MPSAWQDFTTENYDGRARYASVFTKFFARDIAATDSAFEVFIETTTGTGVVYPTFTAAQVTRRVFIPSYARDFRLGVFCASVNGVTGYLRGELTVAGVAPALSADLSFASGINGQWRTLWWDGNLAPLIFNQGLGVAASLVLKTSGNVSGVQVSFRTADLSTPQLPAITARFSWD